MAKAMLNGVTLAESDHTERVEGNHYFPPDAVNWDYFKESSTHTTCSWKGIASYYTIEIEGEVVKDAAWYYPAPKDAAKNIKDHVAFWGKVKVED